MSMGTRLQEALDLRQRTAPDVIAACRLSKGAIYNILNETTKPEKVRAETVAKIAGYLGVSRDWLVWGKGAPEDGESLSTRVDSNESVSHAVARFEIEEGYVRFPLLEGFASMGRGDYVGDYPEVVTSLRVSREWVERKFPGVPPEVIRVMTGRGDSMKGQFNDGDLIFIDTRVKDFDQDSAYCFRWEGRVLVKRLQFVGRNTLRILSKNPDYPAIDAPVGEIEIGGRALAAWTLKEF